MFRGEEELTPSPDKTTLDMSFDRDSKSTQGNQTQRHDSTRNAKQGLEIQLQPKNQVDRHDDPPKTSKRDSGDMTNKFETPKPLNENNSLREALATGVTPLLLGESPELNTDSPSPFVPHYPSACPTPLKLAPPNLIPSPMPSPSEPGSRLSMLSDRSDIYEGFSNMSNQFASVQSSMQATMQKLHDELKKETFGQHEQVVSTINASFGAVRAHLSAIDQTSARTANAVDAAALKLNDLLGLVQSELIEKLEQLMHHNCDLNIKVDALGERIRELESGHLLLRQQLKAHGTLITDPQLVAWGGHQMKVRPGLLKGMGKEAGRMMCEAYGQKIGDADGTEKHPYYNDGRGNVGGGERRGSPE